LARQIEDDAVATRFRIHTQLPRTFVIDADTVENKTAWKNCFTAVKELHNVLHQARMAWQSGEVRHCV
jgi:hypothetical protein